MTKLLSIDIGSYSSKLLLTEKISNTIEVLFFSEKNYAEPLREKITSENSEIVTNQINNLVRDFKNVDNEIVSCNISFGGSAVNSAIIDSSLENMDSSEIITQDQLNLLTKNNPKINTFISKSTAHIIPLEYSLDGMIGIRHPLGMHSKKLSVSNLYVNIDEDDILKSQEILSSAGLGTNIITSESIVASNYLLNSDEKEIGSLIIDIGAGSTDYCYSRKGKPVLIGSLPVGGNQFTSDLSIAFSTNIDFANQLKLETSCTPENERIAEKVIVKQNDSSKTFEITKRQISQVLKERAIELFNLIRQEIIDKLGTENLPERIVLCGGGSKLEGIVPLSRYIFQAKSRLIDSKNIKFLGENLPIESMGVMALASYCHNITSSTDYVLMGSTKNTPKTTKVSSVNGLTLGKIGSNFQFSVKMLSEKINIISTKIKNILK